jgi:hypothetical protein
VSTTYLAAHALTQLAYAQAAIEQHLSGLHGRCGTCGEAEPCAARTAAASIFARFRRLPSRRPGLRLPPVEQRQGFGWFASSPPVEPLGDGVESPR